MKKIKDNKTLRIVVHSVVIFIILAYYALLIFGVYYWSSESNYDGSDNSDKGKSYTFVVRKDNETNVYSYGFVGTQAMARPVRCIRE